MSILKANCPSCAGPIEFKAGSTIVVICPHCRSAVARTDRGLSDLGKVAEIVESQSPLRLGLKGIWRGYKFELTGRSQNRHELGGVWDEWYATFSNGWVGWLAEAQGKFYMTFYKKLPSEVKIPDYESLNVGQPILGIHEKMPLIVVEKGTATAIAAEGEIPFKFVPGEKRNYADLSGQENVFATIDYELNPPVVFLGVEVKLEDLGWADLKPAEREKRRVSAASLNCPNCGAPLSLQAPDKTERVACPYCDSLLDVKEGKLEWLKALKPSPYDEKFSLAIGMKASFGALTNNEPMVIIGAMVRSVEIEGTTYFWHEYLLYNPKIGFRWLVHSDYHWNFVEPVNAALVSQSDGSSVVFEKKRYKIFQDARAKVEYVTGEFYWRVEQGETVRAIDYVAPPNMLSCEITENEINWSLGHYLPVEEVEKAFEVKNLPKPHLVAPNQPFTGGFYIKWGILSLVALIIITIAMCPFVTPERPVALKENLTFYPTKSASQTVFTQPFDLEARKKIDITVNTDIDNSWADFDIDVINADTNEEVESVSLPIEYYHGVEDGESWSEGSKENTATLSSLPAGKYALRIEASWEKSNLPLSVELKVEQGGISVGNCICAFILLLIIPAINLIRKSIFEQKRWSQSMFSSSGSDSESDDYFDSDD